VSFTIDIGIRSTNVPLFVCFAAFLVTFVITRVITRMIRAGKGPFRDNVSDSGLHVHHAVPGIILLVVGAFVAVGTHSDAWTIVAAVLVGMGTSLVLDEFALILHLDDVYWSEQGRTSVDAVLLVGGVMVLVLLGASPAHAGDASVGNGVFGVMAVNLAFAAMCFAKGKLGTGVIGIVTPTVAFIGAVRLARPNSVWSRRRYPEGSAKLTRSRAREVAFDAKWRSKVRRFQDRVAGFGS